MYQNSVYVREYFKKNKKDNFLKRDSSLDIEDSFKLEKSKDATTP